MKGVYTALVTPFNDIDTIDENAMRALIQFQLASGIDGIVVLGTTGEAPTLSELEKESIIRIAREEIPKTSMLIVGTGTNSTQQTIINSQQAQDLGADALLIVAPYYNKPTQEGLYLHYKAVTKCIDIPVIVYNIPGRSGQNIQIETMQRIAHLNHIIGVKEASGNMTQITEIIEKISRTQKKFSVLSGDDSLALPTIAMGGSGVISVVSNLLPIAMKFLVSFALQHDLESAQKLHYQLMPLFRAAFLETNPIPIKAALKHAGISAGGYRMPLCEMAMDTEKKLKQVLENPEIQNLIHQNYALYRRDPEFALAGHNM